MGHKIDPRGFRVGPQLLWKSRWFSDKKGYAANALADVKVRRYLREKLRRAGLEKVDIERSLNKVKIIVYVGRPGVVIGKGGASIQRLNSDLSAMLKSKITIDVETVKDPDTSAALVADTIARKIEKRFNYRRLLASTAERAMEKGVVGIKIQVRGVLGGPSSIARQETVTKGAVSRQTIRAEVDFAKDVAKTTYGTIGVKVWIYKGKG